MINVQIKLSMADPVVTISDEDLEEALSNEIRHQIGYAMRDQINSQLRDWISESMEEKKQRVMESLAPEIEKIVGKIRLASY